MRTRMRMREKVTTLAGFRRVHMRTFCYSIRNMNYRQMRAYALYGIQPLYNNISCFLFSNTSRHRSIFLGTQ